MVQGLVHINARTAAGKHQRDVKQIVISVFIVFIEAQAAFFNDVTRKKLIPHVPAKSHVIIPLKRV
jgi:hypothetical protein